MPSTKASPAAQLAEKMLHALRRRREQGGDAAPLTVAGLAALADAAADGRLASHQEHQEAVPAQRPARGRPPPPGPSPLVGEGRTAPLPHKGGGAGGGGERRG